MQFPAILLRSAFGIILTTAYLAVAQNAAPAGKGQNDINGIDSYGGPALIKYQSTANPMNRRIDMFLSDWQGSMPRVEHGSLVLRDILTKGDNFAPSEKGAVLHYANFLAYGRLAPGYWTTPSLLKGQQEIYYVLGGEGEITAGGDKAGLRRDIAVLVPAGLEFVMHCTGDDPLTMYVINEPLPEDNGTVGDIGRPTFHPQSKMVIVDETQAHRRTPAGDPYIVGGASGHWAHIVKELFSPANGLATLQSVITVTIDPETLGEPHPHEPGQEEVWAAIDGTSLAFLGTELRVQKPGMAYMLPPDGITIHSNIDAGNSPVRFLYFARFPQGANWRHGAAAGK